MTDHEALVERAAQAMFADMVAFHGDGLEITTWEGLSDYMRDEVRSRVRAVIPLIAAEAKQQQRDADVKVGSSVWAQHAARSPLGLGPVNQVIDAIRDAPLIGEDKSHG